MRILIVSDVSPAVVVGGAERVVWEEASRLAVAGHRVRVVSRAPEPGGEGSLIHHGIPLRHFAVDRRTLRGFIRTSIVQARRAVTEDVRAHGADVLHLHQPLAAFGALISPVARRLPSLYTFHSPAPLEYHGRRGTTELHRRGLVGHAGTVLLWGIERMALARVTRIHVLSDFSARLLHKLYRIPASRIVKIPGGVDLERFRPSRDRTALRRELGLPAGRRLLLTVRNLAPRMGLDTLVRAMDRVRRHAPDALLLIGGAGALRRELEDLTASLQLQEHVRFLGFVPDPDLPRYYGVADAFVLPTRALEGFGLVTVEALACGTPVLGTPVGATPEILLALDPALVFATASDEALAEGVTRFLDGLVRDPAGAQRLRDASRHHAEARYSWKRALDELQVTLQDLVDPRPATAPGACPVCDARRRPEAVYRGRPYEVCRECGTAVMREVPSAARLRAFYEHDYPTRFAPDRISQSRAELFTGLLTPLGPANGRRRLLDLGCGGGQLMLAAQELGWRPLGSDVAYEACGVARRTSGGLVVQAESSEIPLRHGSVEAVTLVNVLDHLADPARALAEARRVLSPQGVLLVRVPNGAFHRASMRVLARLGPLARRWGLDAYPVLHVFSFTARGLRRLVERAGFRVLQVRNSPLAAEGSAWSEGKPAGLRPWVRTVVGGTTALVERLSGRRWLWGPSIELYACRAEGDPRP